MNSSATPYFFLITGLSGAGKTTLSVEVARQLRSHGITLFVIDGDVLRAGVSKDLGFSESDRSENLRRAGAIAHLAISQGMVCVCAMLAPFAKDRTILKETLGSYYKEIYLKCSIEKCIARDPKGNYKKALSGKISNYTGVSSGYEVPASPDIVIDTESHSQDICVEQIMTFIAATISNGV